MVFVKIGDHNYYGLCDLGTSLSAIPFSLYEEVMNEITPCEIEDIDVTITLANKEVMLKFYVVRSSTLLIS